MLFLAPLLLAVPADLNLELRAIPLPKALAKLSEVSGLRLEPSPALGDRVVMMRLKNAAIGVTLDRLADLEDAEWIVRTDGTRVLRPSREKERATKAEFDAKAAEILNLSLEYVRKRLGQQPATFGTRQAAELDRKVKEEAEIRRKAEEAEDWDRAFTANKSQEETPGWRALARVLPTLPKDVLLSMRWDGRQVWKEHPTPAQRAFGPEAQRALRTYREELFAWKPELAIERVQVEVIRWEHGLNHSATLKAFDADGKVLDTASIRLANDSEKLKIPLSQRNKPLPAVQGERFLEPSAEGLEYAAIINSEVKTSRNTDQMARWLPKFLNPETEEPTQWSPCDLFLAAAKELDVNFVGVPQELCVYEYGELKRETAHQFLSHYTNAKLAADGWLTLKPEYPTYTASRRLAGNLLRRAYARGGVSIDDAADFAAATDEIWPFTNWVGAHLGTFTPRGGGHGSLATTIDGTLLRFWAGLGGQRTLLLAGQSVELGRLPNAAKPWLTAMIFDDQRVPNVEPTEVFANGISGALSVTVEEGPLLMGWSAEQGFPRSQFALTPEEFGRYLANGNGYTQNSAATFRSFNRFKIGRERRLKFRFDFGSGVPPLEDELRESFFPNGEVDRLPDAIAKSVAAAQAAATGKEEG